MITIQINIGNIKVFHLSGTSSLVIGKSSFEGVSSNSKTNNGVGSAYGDGSNINMSPYNSPLHDPDQYDIPIQNHHDISSHSPEPISHPINSFNDFKKNTPYWEP
ncbi:hypothetical protein [Aquibacillus kalidii]|uniref:hypothetical protein n=1 Tax=Aquibacillus kalidii TaxID=2762597 RepID=UPI0016480B45|nr:hypothetical protein [Aquibacillus kalidii]